MTVHVHIISFNLEFHLIIYEFVVVQIQTWTQQAAVVTTARCVRAAIRKKNKYLDQYQTIYINLHASQLFNSLWYQDTYVPNPHDYFRGSEYI